VTQRTRICLPGRDRDPAFFRSVGGDEHEVRHRPRVTFVAPQRYRANAPTTAQSGRSDTERCARRRSVLTVRLSCLAITRPSALASHRGYGLLLLGGHGPPLQAALVRSGPGPGVALMDRGATVALWRHPALVAEDSGDLPGYAENRTDGWRAERDRGSCARDVSGRVNRPQPPSVARRELQSESRWPTRVGP